MSQDTSLKLSKLSPEIRHLIKEGIYSLYEVTGNKAEAFLLITNDKKFFLLSYNGEVLKEIPSSKDLPLRKTTIETESRITNTLKLNYA